MPYELNADVTADVSQRVYNGMPLMLAIQYAIDAELAAGRLELPRPIMDTPPQAAPHAEPGLLKKLLHWEPLDGE